VNIVFDYYAYFENINIKINLYGILFYKYETCEGEQMPAKKVKNDNKEKELIKKLEPISKETSVIEQIDLEDEQIKSKKHK
jgi:hypothetical protein